MAKPSELSRLADLSRVDRRRMTQMTADLLPVEADIIRRLWQADQAGLSPQQEILDVSFHGSRRSCDTVIAQIYRWADELDLRVSDVSLGRRSWFRQDFSLCVSGRYRDLVILDWLMNGTASTTASFQK